jgi:hypothetical protein
VRHCRGGGMLHGVGETAAGIPDEMPVIQAEPFSDG